MISCVSCRKRNPTFDCQLLTPLHRPAHRGLSQAELPAKVCRSHAQLAYDPATNQAAPIDTRGLFAGPQQIIRLQCKLLGCMVQQHIEVDAPIAVSGFHFSRSASKAATARQRRNLPIKPGCKSTWARPSTR